MCEGSHSIDAIPEPFIGPKDSAICIANVTTLNQCNSRIVKGHRNRDLSATAEPAYQFDQSNSSPDARLRTVAIKHDTKK
jgi:hypothetical protein